MLKKTRKYVHRKVTPKQMADVVQAFSDYIDNVDDPLIAEFVSMDETARKYIITQENVQQWPELHDLKRILLAKQERYLVRKGMNGQSAAMAIFRLKQPSIGYRDRVEQDVSIQTEPIKFFNTVPRGTVAAKVSKSKETKELGA